MSRHHLPWAVVAGLLLLELVLLTGLMHPAPHSGGDSSAYVSLAWGLVSGQGYTELWDPAMAPHSKYPPVFPALVALRIATGGVTWAALKWVTALTGLVAVLATLLHARGRVGLVYGAGVALLTALSPAVLDYGRWILSDIPFMALTLLALWAADRAEGHRWEGREGDDDPSPAAPPGAVPGGPPAHETRWWILALTLATLANFTRSAGIPLVAALLVVLALRRRWKIAIPAAGVIGLLGALWFLRGRALSDNPADYTSAFWLADPYDPALGTVGFGELVGRVFGNVVGYAAVHLPVGMTGGVAGAARIVGLLVVILGVAGWVIRLRKRPGTVELFVPLYAGLILVWPEVWSGDRFALPLIPLLFLYGVGAVRELGRRVSPAIVPGALAGLAGILILLQISAYTALRRDAAGCRGAAAVGGPYVCAGSPFYEFAEAARWAGTNLPDDAVVLTRKPRIWYALSGRTSRTYPFLDEVEALLDEADEAGARWVLFDFVGSQAWDFLAPAIGERPGAFCAVAGFGGDQATGRPATQLFGILPPELRADRGGPDENGGVTIEACPPGLAGGSMEPEPYSASSPIPILKPSSP